MRIPVRNSPHTILRGDTRSPKYLLQMSGARRSEPIDKTAHMQSQIDRPTFSQQRRSKRNPFEKISQPAENTLGSPMLVNPSFSLRNRLTHRRRSLPLQADDPFAQTRTPCESIQSRPTRLHFRNCLRRVCHTALHSAARAPLRPGRV